MMNAVSIAKESTALALSEDDLMRVLQSSLYPGAAPASIKLVIGYCKAAGLDPMQKPVHIVPMWDSKSKQMRDVIMPGINLYRTQAARSGQFAGMSEPEFGEDCKTTLGGQEITFPEWCRVTVKRTLDNGVTAEFTAREYWMENYAIKGGAEKSIAPNAMWLKRPRGQIAKCAGAQALRIAFPEIASQPTADEMEGKAMHADDAPPPAVAPRVDVASWINDARATATDAEAASVWAKGSAIIAATKNMDDYKQFKAAVMDRRLAIKAAADAARTVDAVDPFIAEMDAAAEGATA